MNQPPGQPPYHHQPPAYPYPQPPVQPPPVAAGKGSFWETPTKVLGFFGALIGVITGLITLASQLGAFGDFRIPFLPGKAVAAISISVGEGPSGTMVTVTGRGFDAGETVEIRFHADRVGDAVVDDSGAFTSNIKVPGTYDAFAPNTYDIVATGNTSARHATASFKLTAGGSGGDSTGPASIGLSVGSGRSGTKVTVTGQNFSAGEEVTIRFEVDIVGTATVDKNGRFSTSITVPGTYDVFAPKQCQIIATGTTSAKTALRPFQLTK